MNKLECLFLGKCTVGSHNLDSSIGYNLDLKERISAEEKRIETLYVVLRPDILSL